MSAISARARATGPTSAGTRGRAEEDTRALDLDPQAPPTPEESPRRRGPAEEDPIPPLEAPRTLDTRRETTKEGEDTPPALPQEEAQGLSARRALEREASPRSQSLQEEAALSPLPVQTQAARSHQSPDTQEETAKPRLTDQEAGPPRRDTEADPSPSPQRSPTK